MCVGNYTELKHKTRFNVHASEMSHKTYIYKEDILVSHPFGVVWQ